MPRAEEHAVPLNSRQLNRFIKGVSRLWLLALRRRSQRGRRRWTWERMQHLIAKYLPRPRILHPYPGLVNWLEAEGFEKDWY